ncbi:hypothetical protein HYC85_001062 [Camellia sinensis]|uniref:Uncharacterized protein n=1 Tax=Camellia sinensis TaxID=4442 RepID=A0A7J7I489_CAMSI|nr:hypothetical protein HYC85_001062 [Camellia sinensis]
MAKGSSQRFYEEDQNQNQNQIMMSTSTRGNIHFSSYFSTPSPSSSSFQPHKNIIEVFQMVEAVDDGLNIINGGVVFLLELDQESMEVINVHDSILRVN